VHKLRAAAYIPFIAGASGTPERRLKMKIALLGIEPKYRRGTERTATAKAGSEAMTPRRSLSLNASTAEVRLFHAWRP
jgi:hypothetical protein